MLVNALNEIVRFMLEKEGHVMTEALKDKMQQENLVGANRSYEGLTPSLDDLTLSIMGESYLSKVDEGQPKGTMANLNNLKKWVSAKQLAPPENVDSFASGVQAAIYKRGTIKRYNYQGADFLDYILNERVPKFVTELANEIADKAETIISEKYNA